MALLRTIEDVETLILTIVSARDDLDEAPTKYSTVRSDDDGMLHWPGGRRKYAEFQSLEGYGLGRVGTVGDGNCLLHSLLFLLSPTYRAHDGDSRSEIADAFRDVLKAREAEIRDLADITYAEIGGASALEESFEILQGDREEINIELAPLIGRLYGVNLLAVQINPDMTLRPVCATWAGFDAARPTILVNYLGGGLDFGNVGFMEGGHYEAIFAPVVTASEEPSEAAAAASAGAGARRSTRRKAAPKKKAPTYVTLNEVATQYVLQPGAPSLAPILEMFETQCVPEMSEEAIALQARIRNREEVAARVIQQAIRRRAQTRRATSVIGRALLSHASRRRTRKVSSTKKSGSASSNRPRPT
jgi:hypothetical protein